MSSGGGLGGWGGGGYKTLRFAFNPISPAFVVPLAIPDVVGFEMTEEPSQDDVDAVSEVFSSAYEGMPPAQQAVVRLLLQQAAD